MRPVTPRTSRIMAALIPAVILLTSPARAETPDCAWDARFDDLNLFYHDGWWGFAVLTADVDEDGDLDTIVGGQAPAPGDPPDYEPACVLLNNGTADPTPIPFDTPNSPPCSSGATGDFDADGHVDVAFARFDGSVALHRGLGDGTFDAATLIDVGQFDLAAVDIVAVDLDGDGILDLVRTDPAADSIRVLLGTGDGTFAPASVHATGASPVRIATLDADGDGRVDLFTANFEGDDLSVLRNLGGGNFAPAFDIPVGDGPTDVVTGDFDGDGVADLAVCENLDATVSTLVGDGDGMFSSGATLSFGGSPPSPPGLRGGLRELSPIDLDGDAYTDLVGGFSNNGDGFHVLATFSGGTGAGDPGLVPGPAYAHAPGGRFAVADMDGDGIDDVAAHIPGYQVLRGRGDGTLDGLPALAMDGWVIEAADMNGDGIVDVLAIDDLNTSHVRVALGRGDGTFEQPIVTFFDTTCGACPLMYDGATGDLDGDGDPDVVVIRDAEVYVLRNAGDGTLTIGEAYAAFSRPYDVELADLDEDGVLDIVVVDGSTSYLRVLLGVGDGTFVDGESPKVGKYELKITDLDGDGHVDLVSSLGAQTEEGLTTVTWALGNGDGTFQSRETIITSSLGYIQDLLIEDLDGNGAPDVLLGGAMRQLEGECPYCAALEVHLGTGDGTFLPAELHVLQGRLYPLHALAVADLDGDGVLDVAATKAGNTADETPGAGKTYVFPGLGDGSVGDPTRPFECAGSYSIAAADYDGDGDVDLAVGAWRQITLHENTCSGTSCRSDLDGDGNVGFGDLVAVLAAWGPCEGCDEDLDADGTVGFADLLVVLSAWGPCP